MQGCGRKVLQRPNLEGSEIASSWQKELAPTPGRVSFDMLGRRRLERHTAGTPIVGKAEIRAASGKRPVDSSWLARKVQGCLDVTNSHILTDELTPGAPDVFRRAKLGCCDAGQPMMRPTWTHDAAAIRHMHLHISWNVGHLGHGTTATLVAPFGHKPLAEIAQIAPPFFGAQAVQKRTRSQKVQTLPALLGARSY